MPFQSKIVSFGKVIKLDCLKKGQEAFTTSMSMKKGINIDQIRCQTFSFTLQEVNTGTRNVTRTRYSCTIYLQISATNNFNFLNISFKEEHRMRMPVHDCLVHDSE